MDEIKRATGPQTTNGRWPSTNARHLMTVELARRERFERGDAEAKELERIQRLNERFKDL